MNAKLKYLEFIQDVIKRLSNNSFIIKGWTITLISILSALTKGSNSEQIPLISILVIIFFWYLDSYYLHQERLYRKLFDEVRLQGEEEVDFNMSTKKYPLRPQGHIKAFFSKTLLTYYTLIIGIIVISYIAK